MTTDPLINNTDMETEVDIRNDTSDVIIPKNETDLKVDIVETNWTLGDEMTPAEEPFYKQHLRTIEYDGYKYVLDMNEMTFKWYEDKNYDHD